MSDSGWTHEVVTGMTMNRRTFTCPRCGHEWEPDGGRKCPVCGAA
jgi:rubrerythrin